MTQQEAAKILGVSVRTLQRLVQQGRLTPTYQRGKTRPIPIFDKEAIEALKGEICNRPLYKQAQSRAEHSKKQTFGFRAAPEEVQRLRNEAARFGMRPSEYARHLIQLGLESGFRTEADRLSEEVVSLQAKIAGLEKTIRQLREEFADTIEIVLEVAGMSPNQAQAWVEENLRIDLLQPRER